MGHILLSEWITLASLTSAFLLLCFFLRKYRQAFLSLVCWAGMGMGALYLCAVFLKATPFYVPFHLFTASTAAILGIPGVCLLSVLSACLSLF